MLLVPITISTPVHLHIKMFKDAASSSHNKNLKNGSEPTKSEDYKSEKKQSGFLTDDRKGIRPTRNVLKTLQEAIR